MMTLKVLLNLQSSLCKCKGFLALFSLPWSIQDSGRGFWALMWIPFCSNGKERAEEMVQSPLPDVSESEGPWFFPPLCPVKPISVAMCKEQWGNSWTFPSLWQEWASWILYKEKVWLEIQPEVRSKDISADRVTAQVFFWWRLYLFLNYSTIIIHSTG